MLETLLRLPLVAKIFEQHQERLTPRGRYLLWMSAAVAFLGLDTRANQVFKVFAVPAAMLVVAAAFAMVRGWRRPRLALDCRLPARATARRPLTIKARVSTDAPGMDTHLFLSFPGSQKTGRAIEILPRQAVTAPAADGKGEFSLSFEAHARGQYVLRGPTLRATDPLALVASRAHGLDDHLLLVYPRFYTMEDFRVPLGRRYQPGGIPLASKEGEAVEFRGTRSYRHGDPVKNIHWRSWARVGEPVVKEFQEEYFCRIALILDTFVPAQSRREDLDAFEAAVSVVASIASYFSKSEYVVDIFAAGPDVYEVSAGRSLAYLENILDVLACLEPCSEPPFARVAPALFERLSQINSVVAVLQDWDHPRREFLERVRAMGAEIRIVVVKEGPTTEPWQSIGEELGEVEVLTPLDVESRLLAEQERTANPVPRSERS